MMTRPMKAKFGYIISKRSAPNLWWDGKDWTYHRDMAKIYKTKSELAQVPYIQDSIALKTTNVLGFYKVNPIPFLKKIGVYHE